MLVNFCLFFLFLFSPFVLFLSLISLFSSLCLPDHGLDFYFKYYVFWYISLGFVCLGACAVTTPSAEGVPREGGSL